MQTLAASPHSLLTTRPLVHRFAAVAKLRTDTVADSVTVPLHSGRNGGSLRIGNPGNRGGGSRPKSFAVFMRDLRGAPDVQAAIRRAAADEDSRGFGAVLKTLIEYDDEKPAQRIELSTPMSNAERAQRLKLLVERTG